MTPSRFREILELFEWTQRGFARLLGADEALIRRMARGGREIPADLAAWLERLAGAMEGYPRPVIEDGRRRQDAA